MPMARKSTEGEAGPPDRATGARHGGGALPGLEGGAWAEPGARIAPEVGGSLGSGHGENSLQRPSPEGQVRLRMGRRPLLGPKGPETHGPNPWPVCVVQVPGRLGHVGAEDLWLRSEQGARECGRK